MYSGARHGRTPGDEADAVVGNRFLVEVEKVGSAVSRQAELDGKTEA